VKHGFKSNNKNKLMVFERKVLRKIFGPTKERDGRWRIKTNYELDKLIRHKNIINYINAQRLSWFGHLHRMPEERMVKKVYKWKPMLRRPLGRPKNRWEDDIRNDMKKLKKKKRIGLTASRIVIIGNCVLRRPKHSMIEVVAPKEEESSHMQLVNPIL
jgi:hypothetical protein